MFETNFIHEKNNKSGHTSRVGNRISQLILGAPPIWVNVVSKKLAS